MERKFITYFEQQGNDYTVELINAVKDKLGSYKDIKRILIASATGESALKLYGALDEFDVEIINVTHHMGFSGENESDISEDMIKKLEGVGIKTYFCSNVCAMYKRSIYDKLGGFIRKAIFNEDMVYAGTAIKAGYATRYVPRAGVVHSHNYTCMQQFHRNFDIGVSQKDHPEIFEGLSNESEGMKMVKGTIRYLQDMHKTYRIPHYILLVGSRYVGFRLGKIYNKLPKGFVRACSLNKEYWN